MKTYKMKVWHDYQVTETYEVEVQASSEEEAMELAQEAVLMGGGNLLGDPDRFDHSYEANENSIETIED